MYPVLAEIGPYTVHSYGLFIALGAALGLWIWGDEAKEQELRASLLPGLAFLSLLAWLLGSRAAFLLQQPALLAQDPDWALYFWRGGLNPWAGAAPALLVLWLLLRLYKQSLLEWSDALAPALAAGLAVGHIGCFLSGASHGKPTDFPLAVAYTRLDSLAPVFVPLHPTQLYYSLAGVLVYILLGLARGKASRQGQILGLFLMLYFFLYFNISLLRGDTQPLLWGLIWQQWLCILLTLLGLWTYLRGKEKKHA
ncbi:MAG: prolipoprotein diacylglyceryl transferase [Thermodesulfobacteriota bacterium]